MVTLGFSKNMSAFLTRRLHGACRRQAGVRCNNGAATSLHFLLAVMPERNANRLAPATTEPGQDTAIRGVLVMNISRAAPL
jgi:hypothetical protein